MVCLHSIMNNNIRPITCDIHMRVCSVTRCCCFKTAKHIVKILSSFLIIYSVQNCTTNMQKHSSSYNLTASWHIESSKKNKKNGDNSFAAVDIPALCCKNVSTVDAENVFTFLFLSLFTFLTFLFCQRFLFFKNVHWKFHQEDREALAKSQIVRSE